MASFIITPINALTFKDVNGLLPNYSNTLLCDEDFEGAVNSRYVQKFLASNNIRTQINTDYDTDDIGTTIEAILVDSNGNQTPLVVNKIKQDVHNDDTKDINYEFATTGQAVGIYSIGTKAVKSGELNIYTQSEPFEIVAAVTKFRQALDGTKFDYEIIPEHYEVLANNTDNQPFTYWGSDRLIGDPFECKIWVPGVLYKPQPAGETDVYSNQGNLSKLKSISQRVKELKTSAIPPHLMYKISEFSDLDTFYVNNEQFVSEDKGEAEYFGNYTDPIFTISLTQKSVVGLNSDDQGKTCIDNEDMAGIEVKVAPDVSGTDELIITGGYALNLTTATLTQGTSATFKIGSTPGGNDIVRETVLTGLGFVKYVSKTYINKDNIDASFTAYITVTGVAVLVEIRMQTIPNSQ